MSRQEIIQHTLNVINRLPDGKAEEISDFADFIMSRYEDHILVSGIQQLSAGSKSFDFLNNEEDIYTEADLKEKYNA